MDESYKIRIASSIAKFNKKQLAEDRKKNTKRGNPEEKLQHECMKWLKENGFDMTITDSGHSEFEKARVRTAGFSDACGDHMGLACFIEFKAPGKLKNLQDNQYIFLKRKIERGCFACVVDSVPRLRDIWTEYCVSKNKREVLVKYLPIPKHFKTESALGSGKLFED